MSVRVLACWIVGHRWQIIALYQDRSALLLRCKRCDRKDVVVD